MFFLVSYYSFNIKNYYDLQNNIKCLSFAFNTILTPNPTMIGNDFGNKLRQLRLDKGYSQEYMAELLEVSQKTYSNIENNKSPISVERLLKVIHEYQIDASVFLTEKSKLVSLQSNTENHKKNTITFLSEELILQLKERIEEYKMIVHEKNRRIEFLENRLNA